MTLNNISWAGLTIQFAWVAICSLLADYNYPIVGAIVGLAGWSVMIYASRLNLETIEKNRAKRILWDMLMEPQPMHS